MLTKYYLLVAMATDLFLSVLFFLPSCSSMKKKTQKSGWNSHLGTIIMLLFQYGFKLVLAFLVKLALDFGDQYVASPCRRDKI